VSLEGRVAVVTGASKGVGKGVALGLGEAGATVYLTGRDESRLAAAAAEVDRLGGRGIAARCEHTDDAQVEAVFRQVRTTSPAHSRPRS
jgi:dehydrogenase/reductase SDR family member 1